jgi:hypothetical protein
MSARVRITVALLLLGLVAASVACGSGSSASQSDPPTVPSTIVQTLADHVRFRVRVPRLNAGYSYVAAIYGSADDAGGSIGLSFDTPGGGSVDITEYAPTAPDPTLTLPTGHAKIGSVVWDWHGPAVLSHTFADGVSIEIVGDSHASRVTLMTVASKLT